MSRAELAGEDPRARIAAREDVAELGGRLALLDGRTTPGEALAEDLGAIRAALDARDIGYLLIRGERGRTVLAVDRERREELADALAAGFAREPMTVRRAGQSRAHARLAAEGRLPKGEILRLDRFRTAPGSAVLRTTIPVFVELWRFEEEEILAPRENAITRRTLPRREAVLDEVVRHGRTWPTLAGMFADHASDVTFPIDLVFSWVDGTDPEFQRQRARRMRSHVVGEGDDSEARFRQIDELKYALRSVEAFAPWIRQIFIATDSPRPAWLAEHPRVRLVRSEEMFRDPSVLPTHNSHAVESQLHHIEGLSEHFLYSNDDMFFGRPVAPELFFSPGGISKFVEATTRIGLGENAPERSGFENAARVNRAILAERFGATITRHLEHCAAPLRRSVMAEMERELPEDFARTAASRFRSSTDISVTNSLYHYYALLTGRAVEQTSARVLYVETTLERSLEQMRRLQRERRVDMFCLNDGSRPEIGVEERTAAVIGFLEAYFPVPAPWERPA
ncbi:stealth family protein [Homoserinibacter sp. YIM 151385]|uniref:stealth family protein n=1 Tax=Homoserinibacter sp. YIM 151385 TaxID=2985506 RepID=UPI0022F12581|nr:stealth family protein [Homoserinibacter sp. YIM 151385]WBU38355.1 stealth family protein [Homoserinibacter sp. YIM 151385]